MHESSILRMQWFVNEYASGMRSDGRLRVLDVGSYDVNGSYRHLFPVDKYEYTGLDMVSGPNVDVVAENPYIWRGIETDSFDIVISGQAFEHIEFFWVTLSEMTRVLRKDGLMCIIAPNGFVEHRYPVDCYRFFTDGMVSLARYACLEPLHAHTNMGPTRRSREWFSKDSADSMLVARKGYAGPMRMVDLETYVCIPPDHKKLTAPMVGMVESDGLVAKFKKGLSALRGMFGG